MKLVSHFWKQRISRRNNFFDLYFIVAGLFTDDSYRQKWDGSVRRRESGKGKIWMRFIELGFLIAPFVSRSTGKGRLYPAYSLSGSEGEDNSLGVQRGGGGRGVGYPQNNHQTVQSQHNHYNSSQHSKQRAYQQQQQHPLYHVPGSGAGLSDTPTSGNASDETLTDSELTNLARDSTLLVHNGKSLNFAFAFKWFRIVFGTTREKQSSAGTKRSLRLLCRRAFLQKIALCVEFRSLKRQNEGSIESAATKARSLEITW